MTEQKMSRSLGSRKRSGGYRCWAHLVPPAFKAYAITSSKIQSLFNKTLKIDLGKGKHYQPCQGGREEEEEEEEEKEEE